MRIIAHMDATATMLDGKAVAQRVLEGCARRVEAITRQTSQTPCLATVLVGHDPASVTYVKMKRKRCEAVGMKSIKVEMDESTTTQQLVAKITQMSRDPAIHGILLQHPVPHQIDERTAFEAIAPAKDVDGVTIHSFGTTSFGLKGLGSCTPAGIMTLLETYETPEARRRMGEAHRRTLESGYVLHELRRQLEEGRMQGSKERSR